VAAGSGGREHAGEDAVRSLPRPVLVRVEKPSRLHWPSWMSMLPGLDFERQGAFVTAARSRGILSWSASTLAPLAGPSWQPAQVGVGGLSGLDADPAVDGLDAVGAGDDGAQLELGDLRQVIGHPGDPQQHILE